MHKTYRILNPWNTARYEQYQKIQLSIRLLKDVLSRGFVKISAVLSFVLTYSIW